MGISNLKAGLGRKFASWSGERIHLEREIARISEVVATLEQKRERVELMAELDPDWDADQVKPSPPYQKKLPYPDGMVTRWAMQLIREADRPFSSLELAQKIVERESEGTDDHDLVNRVREAIDASLRKKLGKYVRYAQTRPTLWERIDEDPVEDKAA